MRPTIQRLPHPIVTQLLPPMIQSNAHQLHKNGRPSTHDIADVTGLEAEPRRALSLHTYISSCRTPYFPPRPRARIHHPLHASTMRSTFGFVSFFALLSIVRSSESDATVQVDKDSYCQGEMISVTFDSVQGEGIWVGIFRSDDITDFAALPAWSAGKLMGWILTCGERSDAGCEVWPESGEVQLETDLLEENQYTIVISNDRAALSAQAFTNSFAVVTCDMPTPAPVVSDNIVLDNVEEESLADTVTPEPTHSPTGSPVGVLVVDGSIVGTIQAARSQIIDMIRADSDLIGKVRTTLKTWKTVPRFL
jgi:hypothetical protein